ncbi:DUF418 domain-containing protein [Deinococcus radiomollis]|uniref:DUF418 domain-containing protein n=1 Tax=Deinococcus radiomollis TaxID=468916 RepID=UPI0038915C0E
MSLPPASPAAELPPSVATLPAATPPAERWLLPDLLRGLAILGILCVNMQDFAGYDEWLQSGPDRVAQVFIDVFLNGKFISLFAMLFGAGMLTISQRAGGWRLLRRLLWLLLLGSAHFVLLWHGDIISLYACLGLILLLPLLTRPPTWLLSLSGVLLCLWWLALRVFEALFVAPGPRYSFVQNLPTDTGWPDLVRLRLLDFTGDLYGGATYNFQWLLGLLLLGMAAQQSGLLARPARFRPLLRGLLLSGLLLGLPLSAALAWLNTQGSESAGYWEVPVRLLSGLLLGLGYAAGTGLLVAAGRVGWLKVFAAPGRLALSSYLCQSLIMTTLCYPYGLNLYRHVGALPCLLLALTLGGLQLWLSRLWLRRYPQGPAEWLLRVLVYGRASR